MSSHTQLTRDKSASRTQPRHASHAPSRRKSSSAGVAPAESGSTPAAAPAVVSTPLGAESAAITAESRFVGAIDQGTSSTRFILFDQRGQVVRVAQKELKQIQVEGQPG